MKVEKCALHEYFVEPGTTVSLPTPLPASLQGADTLLFISFNLKENASVAIEICFHADTVIAAASRQVSQAAASAFLTNRFGLSP